MKRKFSRHTILTFSAVMSALVVLSLIISAMVLSYKQTQLEIKQHISQVAQVFHHKLVDTITEIDQELDTIKHADSMKQCNRTEILNLRNAVFNNPLISAVSISDKSGKILCTNNGKPQKTDLIDKRLITEHTNFNGPLQLATFKHSAYFYTKNYGNYSISALILPNILKHHLASPLDSDHSILLYNIKTQYTHLSLGEKLELTLNKKLIKHLDGKTSFTLIADAGNHVEYLVYGTRIPPLPNSYVLSAIPLSSAWHALKINNLVLGGISLLIALFLIALIQYSTHRHLSLPRELKRAIKRSEFIVHYQPVVDLCKNRCVGVEALIRWQSNSDELLMPDNFIATAELTGMILPMTDLLVDNAFSDCQSILAQNSDFHLAINLSSVHFQNELLFKRAFLLCEKYKIKPEQIIFELTERHLIDMTNQTINKVMNYLHKTGFKLAIDDFGTGYSSLSYLKHFKFNFLKIDKLFVSAIGTGAITETLNDSIIAMAKVMNYDIIAEGIENHQQSDYLKNKGVKLGQGWLYSKPLPIDKLRQFLSEQNGKKQ